MSVYLESYYHQTWVDLQLIRITLAFRVSVPSLVLIPLIIKETLSREFRPLYRIGRRQPLVVKDTISALPV